MRLIYRYLDWLGYGSAPRSLKACMLALTLLIPAMLTLAVLSFTGLGH